MVEPDQSTADANGLEPSRVFVDDEIRELYMGKAPKPRRRPEPITRPEQMPGWWPEDRPPQNLDPGKIYRGNDGRWYHADGHIANRAERRAAGIR